MRDPAVVQQVRPRLPRSPGRSLRDSVPVEIVLHEAPRETQNNPELAA